MFRVGLSGHGSTPCDLSTLINVDKLEYDPWEGRCQEGNRLGKRKALALGEVVEED
jgi:hypothetical protein